MLHGIRATISHWNQNYQLNNSNIFMAVYENNLALTQAYLNAGIDIHIRINQDSLIAPYKDDALLDSTALHLASRFHVSTEIMIYLLENGANIEARNPSGQTPLHIAVNKGEIGHVTVLLRAGAKTDVRDEKGNTPLHLASLKSDIAFLETLLQAGADPNARDNKGRTAMHNVVKKNNIPAMCALLNHGANIEVHDNKGKTPLHLAASRSLGIKKFFVDCKANFNVTDNKGNTPVFYEIEKSHANKEELQFVNEESVKTKNKEGNTLLHIVARMDCETSLKRILECNPDIHAKNNDGETPIDIAYHYGKHDVIIRLQQLGARLQISPGKTLLLQQLYESDKNSEAASSSSSSSNRRGRKALKAS